MLQLKMKKNYINIFLSCGTSTYLWGVMAPVSMSLYIFSNIKDKQLEFGIYSIVVILFALILHLEFFWRRFIAKLRENEYRNYKDEI